MRALLLIFIVSACLSAGAQKIDSVKYDYGYLYFHEYGKGEPIVLLTGGPGGSYKQLEDVAVTLSGQYRAIVIEQRGTGRSVPAPFDSTTIGLTAAQQDIDHVLNKLKLENATLLGHSWGGRLALSFACLHPEKVKGLVLIAPGVFKAGKEFQQTVDDNSDARFSLAELERKNLLAQKLEQETATRSELIEFYMIDLLPNIFDKKRAREIFNKINEGDFSLQAMNLILADLQKVKFDISKSIAKLSMPVHVIGGRQDPLSFISYEIKILNPKTKLHWIAKSGHFPMYEQPDAFKEVLLNIVKEL